MAALLQGRVSTRHMCPGAVFAAKQEICCQENKHDGSAFSEADDALWLVALAPKPEY
jgi:hypothetical protein